MRNYSSLVIIALYLFSFSAQSQNSLREGFRIVGGGLSVRSFSEDEGGLRTRLLQDREYSSFSISPYYGRFFNDEAMVGLYLNVGLNSNNSLYVNSYDQDQQVRSAKSETYGVGSFLRRYFQISDRFGSYLQLDAGYSWGRTESFITNVDSMDIRTSIWDSYSNTHSLSVSATLGVYFFVVDAVSIEMSLGSTRFSYSRIKEEELYILEDFERSENRNRTDFSINFINQISFDRLFTINYYF